MSCRPAYTIGKKRENADWKDEIKSAPAELGKTRKNLEFRAKSRNQIPMSDNP